MKRHPPLPFVAPLRAFAHATLLVLCVACGDDGSRRTLKSAAATGLATDSEDAGRSPRAILALGDSYTIGEAVDANDRWPNLLTALLRERGRSFGDPVIVARTGWTTGELLQALDEAPLRPAYDLVTLLIGVNNQVRGLPAEDYRREFIALLDRSIQLAEGHAGRVIVLSIPDWGATPFAEGQDRAKIAAEIDAFNAINRLETLSRGARYLDITPISREARHEPAFIAPDALHPSSLMYQRWADQALPLAEDALTSAPIEGRPE